MSKFVKFKTPPDLGFLYINTDLIQHVFECIDPDRENIKQFIQDKNGFVAEFQPGDIFVFFKTDIQGLANPCIIYRDKAQEFLRQLYYLE